MRTLAWLIVALVGGGTLIGMFVIEPLGTVVCLVVTALFVWALLFLTGAFA